MDNSDGIRNLEQLIKYFCSTILTTGDKLDSHKGEEFVSSLKSDEISILNEAEKERCRRLVQIEVFEYIQCSDGKKCYIPFAFDTDNNFKAFISDFVGIYKNKNNKSDIPEVLKDAFAYIDEMSEHYRTFEQFLLVCSQNITDNALSKATDIAKQKADEAVKTQLAEAIESKAKKEVERAVNMKMAEVAKTTSETSVTILGIFATVVLTVVAGLIYSSSVLNNIATANFYRLVSGTSLVGIVCFNLISSMYAFVERIKNNGTKTNYFNFFVGMVNVILVIIFVVFVVLDAVFSV